MSVVHNTPWLHSFEGVRMGCTNPPAVFAYQGWITRERGVERLVRAFSAAALHNPTISLLIAGGGESLDDVQREVALSGVEQRITLRGEFRSDELSDVLSKTDVGVIPFDQDEFRNHTIPNKLFDYMACGKPVIVSDCAPVARIVNETGCGIVTNNKNPEQLIEAIKDMPNQDVAKMSENGLAAAKKRYNWEQDAHHLLQFIAGLL
jgi:glycosyltransferase involved in cell wall biosynthesis